MSTLRIPPCPQLQNHISHFWVGHWDIQDASTHSIYYQTASSLTEIVFAFKNNNPASDFLFSSVQGQTSLHGQYAAGGFCSLFGVALYSYAVPFLADVPATALNNQFLSVDTFFGNDGKTLTEKIALANTTEKRISILSDYFKQKIKRYRYEDTVIDGTLQHIHKYKGQLSVSKLAEDSGLSQKQFERRFKAYAGFTPKLYTRIVRFENVLNNYPTYPSLTDAAYANGYYDQAHFIHEFKTFAGYSPNKFFALSGY
jgi:AraC-like DNA-binding protein